VTSASEFGADGRKGDGRRLQGEVGCCAHAVKGANPRGRKRGDLRRM